MTLVWDEDAWDDYIWWQTQDRKILKRINTLIKDIDRNGNEGIGKPEPLKDGFQGYWSRRITDEHRLIYKSPTTSSASPRAATTTAPNTHQNSHLRCHLNVQQTLSRVRRETPREPGFYPHTREAPLTSVSTGEGRFSSRHAGCRARPPSQTMNGSLFEEEQSPSPALSNGSLTTRSETIRPA